MEKLPKATLNTLLSFIPNNEEERNIYENLNKRVLDDYCNKTKMNYSKNIFYLGGQLKMSPDEEITLDKINQAKLISIKSELEYGVPCNSFEDQSILHSKNLLNEMEEIIIAYNKINELRNQEVY